MDTIPLLVDFAAPSSVFREEDRISALPIIGNGPPGTFVLLPAGLRVSLPTDQIIFADDTGGGARVGFGGMQFVGADEGHLVFVRIREVLPPNQLSPDRSHTMRLDAQWWPRCRSTGNWCGEAARHDSSSSRPGTSRQ